MLNKISKLAFAVILSSEAAIGQRLYRQELDAAAQQALKTMERVDSNRLFDSMLENLATQSRQALDPLTKKTSLIAELKFLRQYGVAAKSCLDEMVCKDLASDLASAQAGLTALGTADSEKIKVLNAAVESIKARQKTQGCDKNPTCPK